MGRENESKFSSFFKRVRREERGVKGEKKEIEDRERELKEYLEREVYPRFRISEEDEIRAVEGVAEDQIERIRRSFENMRFLIFKLFELDTLVGRINQKEYERARQQWLEECAQAEKMNLPTPPPPKPENFCLYFDRKIILNELEEELKRVDQTWFLCVNLPSTDLLRFLGGETFFTSEQERLVSAGKRLGFLMRADEYVDLRKKVEQALGFKRSPLYGTFSSQNGFDEYYGGGAKYGSMFLKIKRETLPRTSFCVGDSMSGSVISFVGLMSLLRSETAFSRNENGSAVYDPEGYSRKRQIAFLHAPLAKAVIEIEKKRLIQTLDLIPWGIFSEIYLEAHIPEGIGVEDIESVNIPRSVLGEIKSEELEKLKETLARLNIPFVIIEDEQSDR